MSSRGFGQSVGLAEMDLLGRSSRHDWNIMVEYKVVETSRVTDDELERIINEYVGKGWLFNSIQFAIREASRRPSMAFLMFTKERGEG